MPSGWNGEIRMRALRAIGAALADDDAALEREMDVITSGLPELFIACTMWADVCRFGNFAWLDNLLPDHKPMYTLQYVDRATGKPSDPDSVPEMRAKVWADRLVVAIANRDVSQSTALMAALSEVIKNGEGSDREDQLGRGPVVLFRMACDMAAQHDCGGQSDCLCAWIREPA